MSGLEVTLDVESSKSCSRFGPLSLNSINLESTLSDFVKTLLYRLEDEGKIRLPDDGDELIVDREDFRVCRSNNDELDLSSKLLDLSCVRDCLFQKEPLLLKAKSEGFLPTEVITKARTKLTKGPPLIPDRDVSLEEDGKGRLQIDPAILAGLRPLSRPDRAPRRRQPSRTSESDVCRALEQRSSSQLTNSSSDDSASVTSGEPPDFPHLRRQTAPVVSLKASHHLLPHHNHPGGGGSPTPIVAAGNNSLAPPDGSSRSRARSLQIQRTPSPSPLCMVEEEGAARAKKRKPFKMLKNPSLTIVYDKVQTFEVDFQLLELLCLNMECQGSFTVKQIKQALWAKMSMFEIGSDSELMGFVKDPEKYVLKYTKNERLYELIDEQQIFQATALVKHWSNKPEEVKLIFLEQKRMEDKQEQIMNIGISTLLGFGLYEFTFADNGELEMTRRKLVGVRQQAICDRVTRLYTMEPDCVSTPLPAHILSKIDRDTVVIQIHCLSTVQSKTYYPNIYTTADDFLADVLKERDLLKLPQDSKQEDFVLKMPAKDSYIIGSYQLINFKYIRKCLSDDAARISVHLIPALDCGKDLTREMSDWDLVDESTGVAGTHQQLSALGKPHEQVFVSSMWDIPTMFRVRAVGLDSLRKEVSNGYSSVHLEVGIHHGGRLVVPAGRTHEVPTSSNYPRWNQWLKFPLRVRNLPKAARLHIRVLGRVSKEKKKELSKKETKMMLDQDVEGGASDHAVLLWVNFQIVDHRSLLRQGRHCLTLWPAVSDITGTREAPPMSEVGTTACNPGANQAATLHLELDSYAHPVACPVGGLRSFDLSAPNNVQKNHQKDLEQAVKGDPLRKLNDQEKELILAYKIHLKGQAQALPKYLQCVDWLDAGRVAEMHALLDRWTAIDTEVALELLDYHYSDEKVRSIAVRRLEVMENDELVDILLQLVQVLKFEAYDGSALARFLLRRALMSKTIGHFFFWYLKAEMDHPGYKQRFGILLEAYLRGCGEAMLANLQKQHEAVQKFVRIAVEARSKNDKKRNEFVRARLQDEVIMTGFSPIIDPSMKTGPLLVNKSKVMVSKKAPLWIEFENSLAQLEEQRSIKLIVKHGDDLRQDMLTLQMLKIMDRLWQEEGLYLHIIPYGCIATGQDQGVIEVVQNAETVAKIQSTYGGKIGGSFKEDPIYIYLQRKNPNSLDMQKATKTFMLSCAGYCVGTYVLGIGDRHNDNIMVSSNGNLFHIDFGHFLGNIKYKAGVKRELAPFVLTPDFVYIMGGKDSTEFRNFEETCVKAYLILRRHANLFINLFSMMKSTGIPELQSVKDIEYLRKVFLLGHSEAAAADGFKEKIQECLRLAWTVQINWLLHSVRN